VDYFVIIWKLVNSFDKSVVKTCCVHFLSSLSMSLHASQQGHVPTRNKFLQIFLVYINTRLNRDAGIHTLNVTNLKTDVYKHTHRNTTHSSRDIVAFLADMEVHFFSMVQQHLVDQGLLVIEASRSQSVRHTTLGRTLWTSNQPDAQTPT
jgi:hypothetical protein